MKLPKIRGVSQNMFANSDEIAKAQGKTILSVEYGVEENRPDQHQSQAVILHFTDGSKLGIQVVTNAGNLVSRGRVDREDEFHADLIFTWKDEDGEPVEPLFTSM